MKIQNKGDKFQNWLQIGQGAFVVACGSVCVCVGKLVQISAPL